MRTSTDLVRAIRFSAPAFSADGPRVAARPLLCMTLTWACVLILACPFRWGAASSLLCFLKNIWGTNLPRQGSASNDRRGPVFGAPDQRLGRDARNANVEERRIIGTRRRGGAEISFLPRARGRCLANARRRGGGCVRPPRPASLKLRRTLPPQAGGEKSASRAGHDTRVAYLRASASPRETSLRVRRFQHLGPLDLASASSMRMLAGDDNAGFAPRYASSLFSRSRMMASASFMVRATNSAQLGMSWIKPCVCPADQMP